MANEEGERCPSIARSHKQRRSTHMLRAVAFVAFVSTVVLAQQAHIFTDKEILTVGQELTVSWSGVENGELIDAL